MSEYNPCPRCKPAGLKVCSGDPKYCPLIDVVPIVDADNVLHYWNKMTGRMCKNKPRKGIIGDTLNTLGWFGHWMGKKYGFPVLLDRFVSTGIK
jgi:hypothetical protein